MITHSEASEQSPHDFTLQRNGISASILSTGSLRLRSLFTFPKLQRGPNMFIFGPYFTVQFAIAVYSLNI